MVTLAKRATPSQARLLRIVEGSVLNTFDAKGVPRDTWLARSIAKRAAGTLTAQMPEVLSANTRLTEGRRHTVGQCRACERRAHRNRLEARREYAKLVGGIAATSDLGRSARRGSSQLLRRLPLLVLWDRLKREMWTVSRSGDSAKIEAYKHLLRMIDKLHRELIEVDEQTS